MQRGDLASRFSQILRLVWRRLKLISFFVGLSQYRIVL
jgi:hypothetical protein